MTLLNKTLYGCPDQESFYDVVDALDMQNMDRIETRYREKKGVDKKGTHGFLIFHIYLPTQNAYREQNRPKKLHKHLNTSLFKRQCRCCWCGV